MAMLYPPMKPACKIPNPASGFSRTTSGASEASLRNAENSLDAPGIMARSAMVAMLSRTKRGKR